MDKLYVFSSNIKIGGGRGNPFQKFPRFLSDQLKSYSWACV